MLILTLLSVGGLLAGLLLLRTVPVVAAKSNSKPGQLQVSIIIPARNEEANLPLLLESLRNSGSGPLQVLVIDDGSTDDTAAVAVQYGATVTASASLPDGWTGKTWACHQGALVAASEVLFFLDADTRFAADGYQRIVEYFSTLPQNAALSLLPFHRTQRWYEELSLFFNILVAMGAGGFGGLDAPHLFGQSLLIRKEMYIKAGGHEAVKREILENLHFATYLQAADGITRALGGRGALEMRMFPDGVRQLRESWQKAFAAGAGITSPLVLGLSIYWLAAAMLTALLLLAFDSRLYPAVAVLYLLNVVQIAWYGRQLGTFRWTTALLYPVALAFYFAIFAQSMSRRKRGRTVTWRGRPV
jgi:4,4'-diaponeurosporenoate glycosyltransferase